MSTLSLKQLCANFYRLKIDHVFSRTSSHYRPPRYRPPHWFVQKERVRSNDMLTSENRQFLEEVMQDKFGALSTQESPLSQTIIDNKEEWSPYTRRTGLIARKIGNYPLWLKDGTKVQTTLLQVVDNHVIKYTPPEEYKPMETRPETWKQKQRKNGCLLVGAETIDPGSVTKEYCGLFSRVGMLPKRHLCRFIVSPHAAMPPGTPLFATHFRVGDSLDIRAKTMDRGFQGVMKKWGFKGMPASHGVTKTHRRPGNIGSGGTKARVMPGTKMPGNMGNRWRILRGVKILRINTKQNVLWTLGVAIPGETGAMCYLYDTILPRRKLTTPPPFPTHPPAEDLPLEYFDDSLHDFAAPTISYEES